MKYRSLDGDHHWRFVTNHAHVLECIALDPSVRLRDVAHTLDITERTAAQIVGDLERAGYLTKTRDGRRNRYEVHGELPLRNPHSLMVFYTLAATPSAACCGSCMPPTSSRPLSRSGASSRRRPPGGSRR